MRLPAGGAHVREEGMPAAGSNRRHRDLDSSAFVAQPPRLGDAYVVESTQVLLPRMVNCDEGGEDERA